MFFSKIEICGCQELMDWLKYNSFTSYTVHQLLWDLFPKDPDAKRKFLYREEQNPNTRLPMFYVVSEDKPFHENSFLRIVGVKDYSPQVYVGQQLRFLSRINPVVSRMIKDRKRSQKHDVWADAKKRGKDTGYLVLSSLSLCSRSLSFGCFLALKNLDFHYRKIVLFWKVIRVIVLENQQGVEK